MTDNDTRLDGKKLRAFFALGWIQSAAEYAYRDHPELQDSVGEMADAIREALR